MTEVTIALPIPLPAPPELVLTADEKRALLWRAAATEFIFRTNGTLDDWFALSWRERQRWQEHALETIRVEIAERRPIGPLLAPEPST